MQSQFLKEAKHWLRTSVWGFPLILLVLLLLLTAFKISGSSVGSYYTFLYGNQAHDPNLLYGHPQTIRSDEWLVNTQVTSAQSKSGFQKINPFMGIDGTDLALQSEVPSKDWSTIFKPQNWIYFVLPLEYAFAFKWWLLMFALMTCCYFFALRVTNNKRFSIPFAIAIGLSPFALWWYQTTIFAGLTYAFLIMMLGMRILNGEKYRLIKNKRMSDVLHVAALAFIVACFGIILYPPFQIPIAIATVAFLIGYWLQKKFGDGLSYRSIFRRTALLAVAAIVAGLVGVAFIESHKTTIHNLQHTLYPGARVEISGTMQMLSMFDSFLMPPLQGASRSAHFFTNPSEASNFILLMPFLLMPGFVLLWYEYKKQKRIDWTFLAIQLAGLLFLIRAFVPHGNHFFKLLLLQDVPNNGRLLIGMGLVGIVQIIYMVKKMSELRVRRAQLQPLALLYGLSCLLVLLWVGSFVRTNYPLFAHSWLLLGGLALAFTSIVVALLVKRPLLAAALFLLFTLGSSYRIIPLYRGLGFDAGNAVTQAMDSISKPTDKWSTVDNVVFENLNLIAGRPSITGAQSPNVAFWQQLGTQYNYVYNREAHILLTDDPSVQDPLRLVQGDYFQVKLACTPFIEKNVQFVVATAPLQPLSCLKQVKTVSYPNLTFYLYKLSATAQ